MKKALVLLTIAIAQVATAGVPQMKIPTNRPVINPVLEAKKAIVANDPVIKSLLAMAEKQVGEGSLCSTKVTITVEDDVYADLKCVFPAHHDEEGAAVMVDVRGRMNVNEFYMDSATVTRAM